MKEQEEWRDIKGYEGRYQVSSLGLIKSISRLVEYVAGYTKSVKGRTMKLCVANNGYLQIALNRDNTEKNYTVHRIVAQTFIPNPDNLPCVLHNDDDPTNNCVSNLRWGTQQDNIDDRTKRGRTSVGESRPCSKLTEREVLEIRQLFSSTQGSSLSDRKVGKRYGVTGATIHKVRLGISWKYLL